MRKKLPQFILAVALLIASLAFGQCPPPGLLLFDSQSDIDNFILQYPGCTQLQNDIEITGSGITNLNGFANLTAIAGYVDFYSTPNLTNLSGLNNLTSVGAFYLYYQTGISDLSALSNVTSIAGDLVLLENDALSSLNGLQNLTSVGGYLQIDENNQLLNFTGLNALASVGGVFTVTHNLMLTSFTGIESLAAVNGYLYFVNNPLLANVDALSNLASINGYLNMDNNDSLTNIAGIANINPNTISHLYLTGSQNLSYCNVKSVCNFLSNGGTATISGNMTGCNTTAEVNAACAMTCFTATTWNGATWSNGAPDATKNAIFTGDYATAQDLTACSLLVTNNAQVSVNPGHDLTISGTVTVSPGAALTFESNANLLQTYNLSNTGTIVYKRSTSMRRLDYTYWSSPVQLQNLKQFSPQTVSPPVGSSRFYVLDETTNTFAAVDPLLTSFSPAKGYAIRAPNNFPTTPQPFTGIFTGRPNNGNVSIAATVTAGLGYNLIGNPYPSPIDATLFLADNPGTLYFWTHTDQSAVQGANYASFTNVGMVSAAGGETPNGSIQAGQGFILHKAAAGLVTFSNGMRIGNNNGQFFRNAATVEKHRFWLNLSNGAGLQNQILIGYLEGATSDFDVSMDGRQLETNTNSIASNIGGMPFTIQGRGLPFEITDVVPLSFNALAAGNYTIALDHFDGLFAAGQSIWLKDLQTGAIWDLSQNLYSFASEAGNFQNRFQIVYQNTTLEIGEPALESSKIIAYKQNDRLHIDGGTAMLQEISIFDLAGRTLFESENLGETHFSTADIKLSGQMLLVRIKADGQTVVKKISY